MNWRFKYVTEAEVFPEALSQSHGIPAGAWWDWDEPYKISYREYVQNQAEKDTGVYSVRSAIARFSPETGSPRSFTQGRTFGFATEGRAMMSVSLLGS